MGKNKVRLKSGGGSTKAARWPKGQSSNSNPAKNRHRTAAKARYFHHGGPDSGGIQGATKLTAAALMRHDAVLGGDDSVSGGPLSTGQGQQQQQDGETLTLKMTNKTFDTFASDWTQCTNVAFDKLLRKFQLQNAGHKEMLAVLAAVTEVIKSQGGAETETEYFAALMTTLEVSNTEENLAAVVRLLSLVIKKVPPEVLIKRFSPVCELLLSTLSRHAESQNVALLRGLLGCLSVVLRVQPPAVWSQLPEAGRVFQSLLAYTAHTKPKIRKAGQHAVVAVVRGGEAGPTGVHPASALAANHCISVISASGPTDNAVLYMLVLLRELLPAMPRAQTKTVCETILKLLTLGSNVMVSTGFAALHGLFSSRPAASALSAELNGQLITALYDYQPSINDTGPVVAWLAVMQEALLNLTQLNPALCHTHLSRFCLSAVACWLSDKPEVVKSAGLALRAVISECLKGAPKDVCAKFVSGVSEGLKYQYHLAWPVVLGVLASLAEVVGGEQPDCLRPVLASLAELRGSANFSLEGEVDHVVGRAVAAMGPARLLEAIPLNITGAETDYEFRSSWLLPVLRDNIRNTQLAHFISYFLPLAARCLDRSVSCGAQGDRVGQKTYEVLTYQMWSLLPGYCTNPTDLTDSFKNIARILGTQLGQRKEIRLDILTGLRHLLAASRNLEPSPNLDDKSRNLDDKSRNLDGNNAAEMGRYAKNFLPILFNLYTTKPAGAEEAGQRLAALETIKLYLKLTDEDLLGTMFDRALEKYTGQGVDQFTKDAVLDLLRCLLPYVDESRIQRLYEEATSRISSLDHKEQKKAYRVLEEVCRGSSAPILSFLSGSLPQLQNLLLTSLSSTSPSSQAPRLRCLLSILAQLQEPGMDFALSLIPEAILCIKAVNKKAREGAFTLLVAVGEAMQRWNKDQDQDTVIRRYMEAILVGLAGNPRLIHCTLLAVSRIYFQFRDIFPQDLTEMILSNVLLLLSSSSREVASSALSFIKVFVTTTPVNDAARFVPQIVHALCRMPEDCKRHFRIKSKYLFERLSRKFGHDLVSSLVPKTDEKTHKRLKNIRKELARRARRVSEDGSGQDDAADELTGLIRGRQKTMEELLADSSDDDLDEELGKTTAKEKGKKKGKNAAWIQEGGDDTIVDLLSSDAASRILSTRPSAATGGVAAQPDRRKKRPLKEESSSGGFKVAADGRLIITEDGGRGDSEEEEEEKPVRQKGNRDESDSEEETFESLVASNSSKKRKRGSSEAASMKSGRSGASGMSGLSRSGSQYQPGGSGIHRKIGGGSSSTTTSRPGAEYLSKQGRGDVKKQGRPEPYAYIPLSHKTLNKRKQAKAKGQFNTVVKAARKGASKGNKQRINEVKRMMKDIKVS